MGYQIGNDFSIGILSRYLREQMKALEIDVVLSLIQKAVVIDTCHTGRFVAQH
jgi:chemotaxis regulatin CheY-phosphate phosphatase CheZ